MIITRPEDAKHKYQMFRLLTAILADNTLANQLYFKGGTCASLRGILDRFSVDLDFDLIDQKIKTELRPRIQKLIDDLGLTIKDQSRQHLQYFLKYEAPDWQRNTIKLEITDQVSPKNTYESVQLLELHLYCRTQTIETMVANKLYAATARFDKNGSIAGRDFYDIRHFLVQGLPVNQAVIEERTGKSYPDYLHYLIDFTGDKLSDELLYQDLNTLLPANVLRQSIKNLKTEVLQLLNDELSRCYQR